VKLTNKLGLPSPLVEAIRNDAYHSGDADYSITTLLQPPRVVALKRAHEHEMEEDASDRIYSLQGQSVHTILERAGDALRAEGWVPERRLFMEVLGKKISGQLDLYHPDGHLWDWKLVSVYKVLKGLPPEYEQQVNAYGALLRANGDKFETAKIGAILRDWSKMEAKREADYPQQQVAVMPVPIWTPEKALAFLEERVRLHEAAKEKLPECTPEERWARPTKFAVMKKGGKRAVKLLDTYEDAQALAEGLTKGTGVSHSVEHRPGESIRCESYCLAARFCSQWKKIQQE
jgi:hypothetical protein